MMVLFLSLCLAPGTAWAYFSYPAPSISVPELVELYSGDSQQVTCAVDPLSERQLPGCGMAECPQACDGLENPQTGVTGGCLNADGWCTCAGTMYSTVQTNVSVSSSNPSVARASWAGGVLSIKGYKAGSVTITVNAALAKHESASAQVHVEVVAPPAASQQEQGSSDAGGTAAASESGNAGASAANAGASSTTGTSTSTGGSTKNESKSASGSGSGSGSKSSSGSGSNSTSGSGSNAVSASPVGQTANPVVSVEGAEDAVAGEVGNEAVAEIVSREGERIITVRVGGADASEMLAKVAGTGGRVTFWSGGTADSPDVSLTLRGEDVSAGDVEGFDISLKASKKGSGDVAELLAGVERSVVVELGGAEKLPAEGEMYVRTSAVYGDGADVKLYRYSAGATEAEDEADGSFALLDGDVKVSDGYASFKVDSAAAYVLADDDLDSLPALEDAAGDAAAADAKAADAADADSAAGESSASGDAPKDGGVDASAVDVHAKSGVPYLAVAGVIAAAAAAGLGMYFAMRRKARLAQEEADEAR